MCILWIAGIAAMLIYSIVSYLRVKKQANYSLPLRNNIRRMETRTPFILGLVHPTIYLPFGLDPMTENIAVSHERHHLHRKDHLVKLFSYLLLCLHWFNPLCWIAYFEMGKDMEMSCDEYVLSHYREITKDYGTALLSFSTGHRFSLASPLAFGESSIKERILNVMRYRKASRIVTVLAAVVCMAVLAACGTNGTQPSEPSPAANENGDPVQEDPTVAPRHELEMVSSQWGFATANNWVLSADTGFFCLTTDDRGIFPTWYDPESMTRKDLGTEQLLPYMEQYALFTAGDRLVACTEEYSRINILAPPYDEVTESYQIKDRSGKVWHIFYRSAIVYDRPNDTIYCSLSEKDGVLKKPVWLACVDLKTGSAELILRAEKDPHLSLFGSCSADMLVLMGGRNGNEQQHGEAYTLLFDLSRYETEPDYAGEELKIEDRDPYSGYVFSENEFYYAADGYLKTYKYKTKETGAICPIPDGRKTSSQFIEDGIFHVPGYTSVDGEFRTVWYNTVSGEWIDTPSPESSSLREGYKLNVLYRGFSGTEGDWYCLAENGSNSDPRDREYVFVKKDDYWNGSFKVIRIDGRSPQMSSSMTDLSWITENGAVGFYNSLYTPEKQTTDILAYYDFESLTYKLFELPEMIRGRTNLHKLYLLDNLVIGFSARVEEQGGNNHIIDDSIDSHFVIWDTTNNNLKDVRLDSDYYLYAHKLMISANVDNAFYVLGCYKQERDVLLLKINTDDGSIEDLGVYEEKKNSYGTGEQGVFIGYEDGYTYYKFVEQMGDDIKRSLIRVDGTNEECIIEDMFPGNISCPAENMYFLSDGMLYYYGIDRDKIEGYVFEANLHTGELQYRIATEEEGSRKGVSRHGEYLIFGPPINPSGLLSEDSLLAIKAEDYIENPVFIRFAPIS